MRREQKMAWFYLIVAGLLECGWAIGLKYTNGFTKPLASSLTILAIGLSMFFLALAMKHIPIGTAYAIWTGIGTVMVAVLGVYLFGESRELLRLGCLALIVIGIVGLKLL